jgi:hypothetical protein
MNQHRKPTIYLPTMTGQSLYQSRRVALTSHPLYGIPTLEAVGHD